MAKSLGHQLSVASEPGKGTVFRLTVPLAGRQAATILPQGAVTDGIEQIPVSPFARLSVCCVDDDVSNVNALRALLQQWQIGHIDTCLDVNETLALAARQGPPDLLIIDYQLGQHQNGLALHQQLQQSWPGVPADSGVSCA